MIISTQNLRTLNKGFRTIFMTAYQGGAPMIARFAMRTTSSSAEEFYGWLGAVPGMRKLIDEVQIRNIVDHNFAIKNEEFESTIAVKRAEIERDRYGIYDPLFLAMGTAARQHPDELLADLMIAGFTELCYTDKPFFALNHAPKGDKKIKFSNKTTKKLSVANYEAARANIKSRLNAEGRPMNLGTGLVLVVSPKNEALGRQILIAEKVAGGDSNVNQGTAKLEVWPQLAANEDAWFLLEEGQPVKPFIHQVEVETEFASLDNPEDTHVFLKKQFLHQAYGRGNVGLGLPELAYGSTGEDAA